MKIQLMSDLHLEFPAAKVDLVNTGSDVLILGGDITTVEALPKARAFFDEAAFKWPNVIYLLGNHEHYHYILPQTVDVLRHATKHLPNFHVLDGNPVIIEGVPFFGATL